MWEAGSGRGNEGFLDAGVGQKKVLELPEDDEDDEIAREDAVVDAWGGLLEAGEDTGWGGETGRPGRE